MQVSALTVTSASDGSYVLQGVPKGTQAVRVSAEGFRYISLSLEAFQSSHQSISLTIDDDTQRDWGLMQGFLTLPFKAGTYMARQYSYFDLDPGPGIRDWCNSGVTMNGHIGIDYGFNEGMEMVAAASGVVSKVEGNWPNNPENMGNGNTVFIYHNENYTTRYCHLLEILVKEGDVVRRGQVIALSGNTGTDSGAPHLHFQLNYRSTSPIDLYRDPQNPDSLCHWTKDNDPQYPP